MMRKIVNGKIIEIDNIELFEKAIEGAILGRMATSHVGNKINVESDVINEYVSNYNLAYKRFPYPLNSIESNIKYAVLANILKSMVKVKFNMWVDNALYICIDKEEKLALKFISSTWGINKVEKCDIKDNTGMDNYTKEIGYKEYIWLIERIKNREITSNYYAEFMPDFVKACNNQPMVMKWELANILTFGHVPKKIELKENKILDLNYQKEYTLDIYFSGKRKTGDYEYVFSLDDDDKNNEILRPKYANTYWYDVYEKSITTSEDEPKEDKLKKVDIKGIRNLFMTLTAIKIAMEETTFETFTGIIVDTYLIFSINKRIFMCKAYKTSETKEVARYVNIHGYDRGLVYFSKIINLGNGVKKELIYSYGLRDDSLRLVKIQFIS